MRAAIKTPIRSCKVCRTKSAKTTLERWVYVDDNLVLDRAQILPGRGYYTCSRVCANKIHHFAKRRPRS